jgi:hypothetical protein
MHVRLTSLPSYNTPLAHYTPPPPRTSPPETELGPARNIPGFDNSGENIRSEIEIDGKVVARIYNSGAIEVAEAYADQVHNLEGLGGGAGPDYADKMTAGLLDAFAQFGAEFTEASTAIPHEMWLKERGEAEGRSVNLYV